MEVTGLAGAFDALVCSHDLGYPKEDLRFWSGLEQREHFAREATLFIDDSLSVLRTARAYGIGHLLAVSRPDSRSPVRDIEEFISIEGFDQIMPAQRVERET
jgi:putative hydrolase of the HAD superfamily